MTCAIAGFAANALASLEPCQVEFLRQLPKAELHAHLNGSIPLSFLQKLAHEYLEDQSEVSASQANMVQVGIERLRQGVVLKEIHEFFDLFPAIYALTSTPTALARATRSVLQHFLEGTDGPPEASYLELRTTPRETASMSRLQYLQSVLDELEQYPTHQAALIVSLDRRMSFDTARECIECAIQLRKAGRRIVGVDLCGDPKAGNIELFRSHFRIAKQAGLGITLHIAEIENCPAAELQQLLSYSPDRLGHATFLDDTSKDVVLKNRTCVEICLSSNLLCKTVSDLHVHHIRYYLKHDHPIAICTDDILPFRNSLLGEYALLMAAPPLGLGLTGPEIEKVAIMSMTCRFSVQ